MFNFIKETLSKVYNQFTAQVHALFSRSTIDEQTLKELETLLIEADTGIKTTRIILDHLQQAYKAGTIAKGSDLKQELEKQLLSLLEKSPQKSCTIYILVGINGSGKTTFAGKLAYHYKQQGKKVLLAAADTFRAAAPEQLIQWAQRGSVDIIRGTPGQDPASVVFNACEKYKKESYDILIIDTAGRLQTKINLMKELEKIKRSIAKQLPERATCTLLTVDAMLGQNSFEQAKVFHESTQLDGIVLTKMDGTGKGGIIFAINQELHIPVVYISYGENIGQLKSSNAQEYVTELLNK